MTHSMTGFASGRGSFGDFDWSWELRSVNARGLDLRLRVPDWVPGLEAGLRTRLGAALNRGSVTLALRLARRAGAEQVRLDEAQLDLVLDALARVEQRALDAGVTLAPSRAADILQQRGVLDAPREGEEDNTPLATTLLKDFETVLAEFLDMRRNEGAALKEVLKGQVARIETLTGEAASIVDTRRDEQAAAFRAALARIMEDATGADPDRIAQEIAVLAVKS
ncbi:MAG: YicC/YloC family endoribonuclease, partial [Pseudooceanicola sp.]